MVGKVNVNGKDINAIIIEVNAVEPEKYRNSLIETLKGAAIASASECCELNGSDVWNVLDIIQATLPDEE